MIIRTWEEKDIAAIAQMEARCFSDPWTEGMLRDCLKYAWQHLFLAEDGGQVCGYCCLGVLFEDAEVLNIAVDTPHRGKGIGQALLTAMHEKAKTLGALQCFLEVRVSNAAAIALYEKNGYERYGVRAHYYPDGENAMLMKKTL